METDHILNLKELIQGSGNNLRYVTRYSNCRTAHKENVAEHQYYTAFYALVIAEYVRYKGMTLDIGLILGRAIMHDFDEIWTGDVVRPVKHHTAALCKQIEAIGSNLYQEFVYRLTSQVQIRQEMKHYRERSKASDSEGRIVQFADYLSVLAYLDQEIRGGNKMVMDNVTCLLDYSKHFATKDFEFIRELITESEIMVKDLLEIKKGA